MREVLSSLPVSIYDLTSIENLAMDAALLHNDSDNFSLSFSHHFNTSSSHTIVAFFPPGLKTACFILAAVITITNGVVVTAYALSRRVRASMSLFVLNLVMVDLHNGCVTLPLLLFFPRTELLTSPSGGVALCVFLVAWPQVMFVVAYQSVLLVTVERFVCVAKPYSWMRLLKKWRCIAIILVIWLLSLFISFMPLLHYVRFSERGNLYLCDGVYQQGVVYLHIFLYVILGVPLVTIVVLYLLMYRIARKHTKNIEKLQQTCCLSTDMTKKKRQILNTSKAAKTACLLSTFYLLCWLPLLILLQVSELCKLGQCPPTVTPEDLQRATPTTIFLAFLSCAINPVIYIFRTGSIRTSLGRWWYGWRGGAGLRRGTEGDPRGTSVYTSTTTIKTSIRSSVDVKQDIKHMSMNSSMNSIF